MTHSSFQVDLDYSVKCQLLLKSFYEKVAHEGRFVFVDKGKKSKYDSKIVDVVQGSGCDTILQLDGEAIGIEEKFRKSWVRGFGDLAFETWSCTVPGREKKGWGFTCKADYLNYVFVMEDYLDCFFIKMDKLRELYEEGKENWRTIRTDQINRTECALIPLFNIKGTIGHFNKKIDF